MTEEIKSPKNTIVNLKMAENESILGGEIIITGGYRIDRVRN